MAQWTRAGPITQRSVDRNYLLLIFFKDFNRRGHRNSYLTSQRERTANFLSRISVREEIKTFTSQINKREPGEIYTSLPTNHNTRSRVLITL